ncbi:phage antirepressor KilAC domain-containing protein [Mycolicibacterium fortuitum]|uniref:phage antirepressor KilAC domain-containing protein n=1 Tax=Mycolicibacterium fortuitum TaxID=1766 RepID=UPI0022BA57D9|nr:phage antirepressor KilAC domain-containing protein [Mycolicibacterium fortuitum]WAY18444.1 phage antirepressor KilAC domain-containing protein [Mycolicibacterium fortuitum]
MRVEGYQRWEKFKNGLSRAMSTAANQGHDVENHFPRSVQKVDIGSGATRDVEDFNLTRFAAYLVAMNGDPNMPEVAAAQAYFAIRTREAETRPALPQTREERFALALADAAEIIAEKDATIHELTAPARSWQLLADASGDFSVAEAAKILSRDPSITTGRDRLFAFMAEQGWIFKSRNPRGGWEAYQTAVDTRRLVEKPARPFLNSKTGAYELPAPTIRVTAKGIGKLHELMGGTEPLRFIAAEAS